MTIQTGMNGENKSTTSVWEATSEGQSYPRLHEDIAVDVAIVGAGITGLTAAVELIEAGKTVVVIDALEVAGGVSGFNSGHLTNLMLDLRYTTIRHNFGAEGARLTAESQTAAIDKIEENVHKYGIECEFKRLNGFLYAETSEQVTVVEKEFLAAKEAGIEIDLTDIVHLPFPILKGARVARQGSFHPKKYVYGLAKAFTEKGGQIFEHTRALDVKSGTPCQVITESGTITAGSVIIATHTPIGMWPKLQTKLIPSMSYIIGLRIKNTFEEGLFWDAQEIYHYIRFVPELGPNFIILGGEDHKIGTERDTEVHFRNLEKYAYERFDIESIDFRWSAVLYDPADGMPYIGAMNTAPNVYIGTGYTGEGLTCGTVAGMLLPDLILGRPNPWAHIYDPNRVKPFSSAAGFIEENVSTAYHFVKDRLSRGDEAKLEEIAPGEGRILKINGQKVAAYRSESGQVHAMSPVCSHAGCIVNWNEAESTWDCPCHGGRYFATGDVMNGPPTRGLKELDPSALERTQ